MAFRSLCLCVLTTAFILPAHATSLPRYGTFVYSSLCLERDIGDLNGDRLILVRLPLHDMGDIEWSDGSLSSVPLRDLKIDDKKGRISFGYVRDFDERSGKSNVLKRVDSTISAESVSLISWDGRPFRLTRVPDPGRELPNCAKK